jgi:hypothetical protein
LAIKSGVWRVESGVKLYRKIYQFFSDRNLLSMKVRKYGIV